MNIDNTLLKQALVYLIGGGGSGAVIYWLFENIAKLRDLEPEAKRYASLAGSVLLSWVAYAAAAPLFHYLEAPVGAQAWVEALFAIALIAVTGSQAIHGRRQL